MTTNMILNSAKMSEQNSSKQSPYLNHSLEKSKICQPDFNNCKDDTNVGPLYMKLAYKFHRRILFSHLNRYFINKPFKPFIREFWTKNPDHFQNVFWFFVHK